MNDLELAKEYLHKVHGEPKDGHLLNEWIRKHSKSVWDMYSAEFTKKLASLTTPEQVFENAPRIYDFMEEIFKESCEDSLLREWAFQWYSDQTNQDYSVIYDRWLKEE